MREGLREGAREEEQHGKRTDGCRDAGMQGQREKQLGRLNGLTMRLNSLWRPDGREQVA
jgi:hypothetical protein